jgi:hypothetical protein
MVVAGLVGIGTLGGLAALARCQPFLDDRIAKPGTDGKINRIDGFAEVIALKQSIKVDAATREKIKPAAKEWLLDVQQQVIDNLDFVAELEPFDGKPGFFETFDPANPKSLERTGIYQKLLASPGSLVNVLEFKHLLEPVQAQAARQLVYDYDQSVMKDVMADAKDSLATSKYQYTIAYRDAIGMFHRLLDRAAPKLDEAIAALKLTAEQAEAVKPLAAAVKEAKDPAATRTAVKAVLAKLPLIQQRNLMNKVRDLAPITDPYSVVQ